MTPEQVAFLEAQRVARLATVDEDGRPHALPVCFAALDAARLRLRAGRLRPVAPQPADRRDGEPRRREAPPEPAR